MRQQLSILLPFQTRTKRRGGHTRVPRCALWCYVCLHEFSSGQTAFLVELFGVTLLNFILSSLISVSHEAAYFVLSMWAISSRTLHE